ncbi:MAG TPA: response regulator transcription factor [Thermomicrobiales bacterium]|nr:response regulator transcription factor [Thermomicrobiales bacterium]
MAQILVLADQDARISRIKNACDGWDTDVRWVTASVDQISMLDAAASRACDMAILDHADPIEPRLQAIKLLRAMNDSVRIVVTGIPSDDTKGRTETVFAYLEAGAAGYVGDDQLDSNLVHVLNEVRRGGTWIEPAMTIELIQRTVALHDALEMMKPYSAISGQADMLTRRQQEVLELLAAGLTNKEIADQLYISVGTVKNHVHRILDVLRASSREQAAQYYQFLQAPSTSTSA